MLKQIASLTLKIRKSSTYTYKSYQIPQLHMFPQERTITPKNYQTIFYICLYNMYNITIFYFYNITCII